MFNIYVYILWDKKLIQDNSFCVCKAYKLGGLIPENGKKFSFLDCISAKFVACPLCCLVDTMGFDLQIRVAGMWRQLYEV